MKFNLIFSVILILFSVFIGYSFSVSYQDFTTPKTCSQIFGNCTNSTTDDALLGCNGTQKVAGSYDVNVEEVYINSSAVRPNQEINVTCQFREFDTSGPEIDIHEYILYYDTVDWFVINSTHIPWSQTQDRVFNLSKVFPVNSTEGTHIIRCIIEASIAPSASEDNPCVDFGMRRLINNPKQTIPY